MASPEHHLSLGSATREQIAHYGKRTVALLSRLPAYIGLLLHLETLEYGKCGSDDAR